MVMSLSDSLYTADMVRALPHDGNRYEVVWGELLVTPSPTPRHQRLVLRLANRLSAYVDGVGAGEVMLSPADISWSDDTLVQPDVFVVAPADAGSAEWTSIRRLLLVAEVLSPSTRRQDRLIKRRLYQEQGIETIWLIDGERNEVEVWTPAQRFPELARDELVWQPLASHPPLHILLGALFAR